MPKYLIERKLPNAGQLSPEELWTISQQSNSVLREMTQDGKQVQWVHSYVVDDAIYCVYVASDPEVVREHARCGGFPADTISEVRTIIDPTTGE
jgi:hypothetical protein